MLLLFVKIFAVEECFSYVISHSFLSTGFHPSFFVFCLSLLASLLINCFFIRFSKKEKIKWIHVPIVFLFTFVAVQLRSAVMWCVGTFPLDDANAVLLTLQMPLDEFAGALVIQGLTETIPASLVITVLLLIFVYVVFKNEKKRIVAIGAYALAATGMIFVEIPCMDYVHLWLDEPEKNASYSNFFVENYVHPDSTRITAPEKKTNLIVVYLESMENSFTDKEHGGVQNQNLIPEIVELSKQNVSFGRLGNFIGGGFDSRGASFTFGATVSRSLGVPVINGYKETPAYQHYKSIYKILNQQKYHQVFFQGNPGLYENFRDFFLDQKVDEIYGPDDLIRLLQIDTVSLIKKHGYKTVADKDAFKFAKQILDTIQEPFSLTFYTMDTHCPNGIYDSDCEKSLDENSKEENLKASVRCVSKQLAIFLDSVSHKPYYGNTSIVIFGDHLFMGDLLVDKKADRKWVNIFINSVETPRLGMNRKFSDVDMFPTILSSMGYFIDGHRLGLGVDLFSANETLVEKIGLDSLNKELVNLSRHLVYESYRYKREN